MIDIKNKKTVLSVFIVAVLFVLSITFVNAYYNDTRSMSILAGVVGDFDSGDGDINMLFYKQVGENDYARVFSIPELGFTFDDTKTTCKIGNNSGANVCSNSNPNADCYYHYDSANNNFVISSKDRVTCKFYFNEDAASDIILTVLKEDENGTYEYNSNTYSIAENIPAYGYDFAASQNVDGYTCDNNSTLTYNSETRSFSISASRKDHCYVYFDKNNKTADVTVNVYINNNGIYEKVEYIPQNKTYQLSGNRTSSCTDANATISYVNGSIIISAEQKQTCTVYLDEVE